MKIGIVGIGHVGGSMLELFQHAVAYDKYKGIGSKEEINACAVTFVCVPTPQAEDGSCDVSAVEEVLAWIESEVIVLRSTVPVGFTESQCRRLGKQIVFQPEYYGETTAHPFADPKNRSWITLGGETRAVNMAVRAYQEVLNAELIINAVDATTAELAKYMENCFFALKVTFCNEFYDLAKAFQVDYTKLREAWLLDPRIGRSHTFVYEENRGYAGSCLPKDMAAILWQAAERGMDTTLLEAVKKKNEIIKAAK